MEYWPIIAALIAILGGFAVARYNAYRTASAKFRDVVLSELNDFYPVFTRWHGASFSNELSAKFPILQAAADDFLPSIPWYRKVSFRKAWVSYCNATGRECDMNTYLHYFDSYDPLKSTQSDATVKAQALFHANVKCLLEFAHET